MSIRYEIECPNCYQNDRQYDEPDFDDECECPFCEYDFVLTTWVEIDEDKE